MAEIKKLTKKEKFVMTRGYVADNEMLVEFIDNEIALLEKKANSSKKSKTQLENETIKDIIVKVLTEIANPITITDLQKASDELSTDKYSNQKISALLTQLVNENRVKRIPDKKKTYFTVEVA